MVINGYSQQTNLVIILNLREGCQKMCMVIFQTSIENGPTHHLAPFPYPLHGRVVIGVFRNGDAVVGL